MPQDMVVWTLLCPRGIVNPMNDFLHLSAISKAFATVTFGRMIRNSSPP